MKKLCIIILCFIIPVWLSSCEDSNEFEHKEVCKIETIWQEGFSYIDVKYCRIFDFVENMIYDERRITKDSYTILVQDYINNPDRFPDFLDVEAYKANLNTIYNVYQEVISFSEETEKNFLNHCKKLNLFSWKDEYKTDEIIHDVAGSTIRIYFTDGTIKSTYIYFKYPRNYDKIMKLFPQYLKASCWFE